MKRYVCVYNMNMALNNISGKTVADIDAQLTVEHYNSIGHKASLSTSEDDKLHKYDLMIDGVKFDMKRFSGMYCEIDKLQLKSNEADRVWMIVSNDIHRTYSIKKKALIEICAEFLNPHDVDSLDSTLQLNPNRKIADDAYRFGSNSGDKLAHFSLDMLKREDYRIIDMTWLREKYD